MTAFLRTRHALTVLLLAMLAFAAYVLSSPGAETVLEQRQESRLACPSMGMHIRPSEIHLSPGVIQHQSWVDFPVPARFAGRYSFCLDDKMLEAGAGRLDFRSGVARFHVATRSVDLYWLSGGLDGLRDPKRWELRLTCGPSDGCQ